jgi:hypothetical protein
MSPIGYAERRVNLHSFRLEVSRFVPDRDLSLRGCVYYCSEYMMCLLAFAVED